MPAKRRGFYDQAPVDTGLDSQRERNVEALIQPLIQPKRSIQRDVPIERIRPNPFQARRTFSGLEDLAASMRIHGFISRLRVRPDPVDAGYFQLVYGERRWRAAQLADLTDIPCDISEHTDAELIEIGLLENIQREDLDPLEEAQAFRTFIAERGYTVRSLAERLGKSKGYVDNRLALLRAPQDVQAMVAQRPDTVASARLIAQLPTPAERRPLIDGLTKGTLAAKDVRALIRDTSEAESLDQSGESRPHSVNKRALAQAKTALQAMLAQLDAVIPTLDANGRAALLDYIAGSHFPRLEHIVETLRAEKVQSSIASE